MGPKLPMKKHTHTHTHQQEQNQQQKHFCNKCIHLGENTMIKPFLFHMLHSHTKSQTKQNVFYIIIWSNMKSFSFFSSSTFFFFFFIIGKGPITFQTNACLKNPLCYIYIYNSENKFLSQCPNDLICKVHTYTCSQHWWASHTQRKPWFPWQLLWRRAGAVS